MDIFESLENLNVSEECFDDIMDIVRGIIREEEENKESPYRKTKKCTWCEDEYEEDEINKEGHCHTCQRAIDSRA